MRILPLLLVLALAAPFATAQVPTLEPCGPLTGAVTVPPPMGVGDQGNVVVAVDNRGNFSASVTVAASIVPSDQWRLVNPADQTKTIAAGGSDTFTFTIEALDGATEEATVNFSVTGTCNPPVGACPSGSCDAAPLSLSGQVGLRVEEGLRFPGIENLQFPIEYLIAGIALIGITTAIPFLLRKRTRGLVAQSPEPLKLVRPGRGTSFPIEIRNPGNEPATAQLEVGPVPEGWSAFMPLPEVQLAARETRSLWLMVRAPPTAAAGETVDVELRLRSTAAKHPLAVRVRAEVNPNAADATSVTPSA